jgi:hypothetical protein
MTSRVLVQSVEDVLLQGLELLESVGGETYRRILPTPYSASIGKHYRHVLDHFTSLARGLQASVINYDERPRDVMLENFVEIAKDATISLIEELANSDLDPSAPCSVTYSVGYHEDQPIHICSTVGREISYCVSHAIHHFAIIRLVCAELGVTLPVEFGVAPSTLKHRATVSA